MVFDNLTVPFRSAMFREPCDISQPSVCQAALTGGLPVSDGSSQFTVLLAWQ
jgi:hypothetical protein